MTLRISTGPTGQYLSTPVGLQIDFKLISIQIIRLQITDLTTWHTWILSTLLAECLLNAYDTQDFNRSNRSIPVNTCHKVISFKTPYSARIYMKCAWFAWGSDISSLSLPTGEQVSTGVNMCQQVSTGVRMSQSNQVQNTIQCMHIYEMCMIHLKITWYENVRVSSKHHTVHAYICNVHDSSKNRIVI